MRKQKAPRVPPPSPSPASAPPPQIELDSCVTIVHAAALHRTLSEHLASGQPLRVDGSRVEEIDTAILQLLASLWRSSAERGSACTWAGVSEPLRRAAALIDLAELLHFPAAGTAVGAVHAA